MGLLSRLSVWEIRRWTLAPYRRSGKVSSSRRTLYEGRSISASISLIPVDNQFYNILQSNKFMTREQTDFICFHAIPIRMNSLETFSQSSTKEEWEKGKEKQKQKESPNFSADKRWAFRHCHCHWDSVPFTAEWLEEMSKQKSASRVISSVR